MEYLTIPYILFGLRKLGSLADGHWPAKGLKIFSCLILDRRHCVSGMFSFSGCVFVSEKASIARKSPYALEFKVHLMVRIYLPIRIENFSNKFVSVLSDL